MFSSSSTIVLSFKNQELRDKYIKKSGDKIKFNFDKSAVVIANHQIYSDWFFIWFLAYLNDCADHFFIVMKKSLEKLPILGYGMTNYNFVFLSRNWNMDKMYMAKQFLKMKQLSSKFWMLIFPEGTNMSHNNRIKSHKFATENNLPLNQSVLLPRVKGLYVACKELSPETTKIIDFTIGYSDHGKNEMSQDIFTLWKIYILGQSPKKINILINEYDLKQEIPLIDFSKNKSILNETEEDKEMEAMNEWINKVWQTKEQDMNYYYDKSKDFRFREETSDTCIVIPLRLNNQLEILYVYLPVIPVILASYFIFKLLQLCFS